MVTFVTELFEGLLSVPAKATTATFVKEPDVVGTAVIVRLALACGEIEPNEQEITLPLRVKLPWLGVAEAKFTVAGRVLVSSAPLMVNAPRLVTVIE